MFFCTYLARWDDVFHAFPGWLYMYLLNKMQADLESFVASRTEFYYNHSFFFIILRKTKILWVCLKKYERLVRYIITMNCVCIGMESVCVGMKS